MRGVGRLAALGGGAPLLLVERGGGDCRMQWIHCAFIAECYQCRAASVRGDGEEARVEGVQGVGERRVGDGEEVLQGV